MKKVLMVFLGLALLTQTVRLWERGHEAACAKRSTPAKMHQAHPNGGNDNGPTVMLT